MAAMAKKDSYSIYKKAFNGIGHLLEEKLEVSDGLLTKLNDRKVLTDEHVELIRLATGSRGRVRKLLDFLPRRDDSTFNDFCQVLEEEGQGDISKIIRDAAK